MTALSKSEYYQELKQAGVTFDKHYRDYTTDELRTAYEHLLASEAPAQEPAETIPADNIPRSNTPVDTLAGVRQNSPDTGPIRIDDAGRQWYKEEIRKPSVPKPRARRKLQYVDSGTKQVQITTGEYTETFEVAGDERRASEVKITLPSYQVGLYKDPRFPFKIHVYNENKGFDLFEVHEFYGGSERVPNEVKRIYVENVLCYDIRTTVRAIESEARRLQLTNMKEGLL